MSVKKVALLTGITGMDASIMADLLLSKGYIVHGIIRRSSNFNTGRIEHIFNKVNLHYGDLTDSLNIFQIISKVRPQEIYNFGAQSHVKVSAELENYTIQTNTIGVLNILQAVRTLGMEKTCKIYQANTSETYGNQTDGTKLLNEESPKMPVSIYGISKLAADHICRVYRDAYGMFIVSSTLFNHEGVRRGHTFVTQKIANYVGKYSKVKEYENIPPLSLGNLSAMRDWGSANDYVEAIWLMMQQETPDNYVIATGETHSVREFVELAFAEIGIKIEWKNSGIDEIGFNYITGETLVQVNPKYFRDLELDVLIGDASKAKKVLDWKPKTSFKELVSEMVRGAIKRH
jgi:GDPmannose 4,6-dehydratase